MRLAELVASETEVPIDAWMLLRHSIERTRFLGECGASIQEYTAIQPVGSKYDFHRDPSRPIQAVVVIVEDHVHAVYRVTGILRSGSSYDISSPAYVRFDRRRDRPARQCHYFALESVPSTAVGRRVHGWERRQRTPVQRSDDSFFGEVEVDDSPRVIAAESLRSDFASKVYAATRASAAERALGLREPQEPPARVPVLTFEFVRSPEVAAEVLLRANGCCERCGKPAPFLRKSDRTPYLEVHHRKPLAQGGLDSVANALAVCPNCHREAHYGDA